MEKLSKFNIPNKFIKPLALALSLTAINALAGNSYIYDPVGKTTNPTSFKPSAIKFNGRDIDNSLAPTIDDKTSDNSITVISTGTKVGGASDVDFVYGGYGDNAEVKSNSVTMTGGTVNEDIYGGYSDSGSATNNTVAITGGTVKGEVFGGSSDEGSATNNTVNISGAPKFGADTTIYGGRGWNNAKDYFTGNTLNIRTSALKLGNIKNFEFINFYLPNDAKANNEAI